MMIQRSLLTFFVLCGLSFSALAKPVGPDAHTLALLNRLNQLAAPFYTPTYSQKQGNELREFLEYHHLELRHHCYFLPGPAGFDVAYQGAVNILKNALEFDNAYDLAFLQSDIRQIIFVCTNKPE